MQCFFLPATGKIHLTLLALILKHLGMGGERWLWQFIFGFPVFGTLSQAGCYPVDDPLPPHALSERTILKGAERRFKVRARNARSAFDGHLWSEALEQCDKGWLDNPRPISRQGG